MSLLPLLSGEMRERPRPIPFESAVLDPSNWTVHIEAATADGTPIVIDAMLEDIGSYHRRLEGTWTEGGVENALKIARE